jgi:hypothetical protein
MIIASHVYETLIDLIRADRRGLSISIDEFNRLSRLVNERLYTKQYAEFETNVDNIGIFGGFKVLNYPINLVTGVGSLPSNYRELIGKPYYLDVDGIKRYLDLVSSLELAERKSDYLTQPSTIYPLYIVGEKDALGNLKVVVDPDSIKTIYIDYIRTADIPFLDYYVNDSTLVSTYMVSGAIGVTIPIGYTYRDGTHGVTIKNSFTVDWEWSDSEFYTILSMFSQLVGVQLPDQFLVETGILNETKD